MSTFSTYSINKPKADAERRPSFLLSRKVAKQLLRRYHQWRSGTMSLVKSLALEPEPQARTTADDQHHYQESDTCFLENIPLGILKLILSMADSSALAALSRTNKSFRSYTTPILYRYIRLQSCTSVIRSSSLARTILEKPSLGSHVENVEMFRRDCCRLDRCIHHFNITADKFDLCRVEQHLRCSGIEPIDTWLEALKSGSPAATIAILLSLTPNIVSLDLDEEVFIHPFFLDKILYRLKDPQANEYESFNGKDQAPYDCIPSPPPSPFPYLRSVSFAQCLRASTERSKDELSIPIIFKFLHLPSIRRIGGSMPGLTLSHFLSQSQNLSLSSITELSCTMAPPAALEKLLSYIPNLQHLDYDFWCRDQDPGSLANSLSGAIYPAKSTLTSLRFKTRFLSKSRAPINQCDISEIVNNSPGFLHDFDQLTDLELPWILLSAHIQQLKSQRGIKSFRPGDNHQGFGLQDILPANLETLTINDDLASKVDLHTACMRRNGLIRNYLKEWKTHTPYLQRIRVRGSWNFWNPKYVEDLKKMCVEAKIACSFLD